MNRNTWILLGLLAVLGGVVVLVFQQPGEQSLTGEEKELLVEIDSASVAGIVITSPAERVDLKRTGNEWFVDTQRRFRADQTVVGNLLHQVEELGVNSVVSENPEKQSLFQVDSTGTRIVLQTDEGDSATFVLGKSGPGMADVYARREGSNKVVLVDAAISYTSRRSAKEWRDHSILTIPKEQIRAVGFQYGDTTFALSWVDSVWMVDNVPVKDWAANSLVSTLSDFDADDFLDIPPSPLPRQTATILVAGTEVRFFQQKGNDQYIVTSSTSPHWYRVASWKANQVLKRKKDLLGGI
ncbi:MAG TPA: DUF4340 domain-containing protein [Bacteroidota bacterium]